MFVASQRRYWQRKARGIWMSPKAVGTPHYLVENETAKARSVCLDFHLNILQKLASAHAAPQPIEPHIFSLEQGKRCGGPSRR
jgi:hypothetical protein